MEPLRVLVVDDNDDFRSGIEALLSATPSMDLAASAANGADAVVIALEQQPDVVLMDLHMPQMNGIEATERIVTSSPHIRVLVLTMMEDDESVFAAVRAGARGYLLKGARRAEIVRAIEAVGAGEVIFGPAVAERVTSYFRRVHAEPAAEAFPELTDREREILALIAAGRENSEIAKQFGLSTKTVRNHSSNIFMKLQVAHRAQAIVLAREAGLG
jgi:DNA-binding NarL/FixJ family response regulator